MARQIGIELMRALCVLALVFLSFAHAPLAAATTGTDVLTAAVDTSYCGDLPNDGKAHAPCHACRIGGGADVPAPPCIASAATLTAAPVTFSPAAEAVATRLVHPSGRPRAPPIAA